MNAKSKFKGYIFAIISAVIYGSMPLMAKHIYADGVNALTLVFLRNVLALPSLAVLTLFTQKSFKTDKKTFLSISIPSLFGCAVTPVLLFASYNHLPSGTSTVFHFIYPTLVLLIGIFFLKKKAVLSTIISIALCFVGVALFYDPATSFSWAGAGLALGSGVTFAIYVVMLPHFKNRGVSGFLFSFHMTLWSSVIMLIICVLTNSLSLPKTFTGWGLCILFSFLVTTCAVVLFQQGTFIIGGEKTAILSTLEPITSVVIGITIFGEPFKLTTAIGCILVVGASVLIAVSDMKKAK